MSEAFMGPPVLEPPRNGPGGGGYRAFEPAWGDGQRAAMLGLRLKGGTCIALGYAWLSRVDFDPAGTVTLTFSELAVVVLTGRNLRPVYEAVAGHVALWVAEADRPADLLAADDEPVVDSIRCPDAECGVQVP